MRIIFLTAFLLLTSFWLHAENRPMLESKEEIIRQAMLDLEQAMNPPEGELYKTGQKFNIKGSYTLQLTIRDKGNVVSVYVVEQKDGNIPSQNILKDAVFDFRLSFRMPKKNDYKFNYTFKF
ncbi:MAG TPA: hypothetical protein VN249_10310 [Prolixibacteraceae bacterium]|nr:hypothetical protein [Prolixibacteraceae bacterium]